MTIKGDEIHRPGGDNIVEDFFVGQRGGSKGRISPPHSGDPGFLGMGLRIIFHSFLDFGDRLRVIKVNASQPH